MLVLYIYYIGIELFLTNENKHIIIINLFAVHCWSLEISLSLYLFYYIAFVSSFAWTYMLP